MTPPLRAGLRDRYRSVEDAYRNDNTFRAVVDAIEAMIHRADITPHEARAAAVLACIHYEMRNASPIKVAIDSDTYAELDRIEARCRELKRWIEPEIPAATREREPLRGGPYR